MWRILSLFCYLSVATCFQMTPYESYLDRIKRQAIRNRQEMGNNTTIFRNNTTPIVLIDPQSLFGKPKTTEPWNFESEIRTNFSQIGGYHEIKDELRQVKDLLLSRDLYEGYNIRTPKGMLLEGPPGNGKTLLARCFAGECGFNFVSVSGAEFNEKYVGVGAQRVRELFNYATKNQPCIIFIDELDSIGAKRSMSDEGSSTERFQTLNQLLVLMDGFDREKMKHVFIIGATNRKDILDPALLRSGRFDKIVYVPHPDEQTRQEIINLHRIKKPIKVRTEEITSSTEGLSGADIENVLNEVSLWALRNNQTVDTVSMVDKIRDKIILGTTSVVSPLSYALQERVAVHECGHLLMGYFSTLHESPSKITIESCGHSSLGYTYFVPNRKGLYSKTYLREKIMIFLAGKIAEEILYGDETSTGALDDSMRATTLAKEMVLDHGMVSRPIHSLMSEQIKLLADKQIQKLLEECTTDVRILLSRNKSMLLWLANTLIRKKTLDKEQIEESLRIARMLYPTNDLESTSS